MKTPRLFLLIVGSSLVLASCNPLNKMIKNAPLVKYGAEPNPLELKGDEVAVTFKGTIPPEYWHKKVKADITPVLIYPAGSATPKTHEFTTKTVIGEVVEGEGQKMMYEKGGDISWSDKVKYDPDMETATLEYRIHGTFKKKEKDLPAVKTADGTIITQLLVKGDERVIAGKDQFVRVTPANTSADIHYLVNSPTVRSSELRDDNIKALKTFIDSAEANRIAVKGISVSAYASPDGELLKNENLANDRAESAMKAVKKMYKQLKKDAALADEGYTSGGKGEDWEGFRSEMEASNIADKDLIIRILQSQTDVEKREQEIKNLSKTYLSISREIMPKLRRAMINVTAEKTGYSDDELKTLSTSNPEILNVEEILKAATLFDDLNQKLGVYKAAAAQFSDDWRTQNNIGYVLYTQGKLDEAKAAFEKANTAKANEPTVMNNLGAIARRQGDVDKAKEYYSKAAGAGTEVSHNLGIINVMEGEYAEAVSNLSAHGNSFNLALAKALNGDPDGALSTADVSEENGTALGHYFKAIASARKGDAAGAASNLKMAIDKDSSFKAKAMKNAEFIKFKSDGAFSALLN